MEQRLDQQKQALEQQETVIQTSPSQVGILSAAPAASAQEALTPAAAEDLLPPVTDTQGLVRELAERLGETSGQIVVHRDLSTLLDRMKDGVVVQLSVSRPRFFKKLSLEDLGLRVKEDLATILFRLDLRKISWSR